MAKPAGCGTLQQSSRVQGQLEEAYCKVCVRVPYQQTLAIEIRWPQTASSKQSLSQCSGHASPEDAEHRLPATGGQLAAVHVVEPL